MFGGRVTGIADELSKDDDTGNVLLGRVKLKLKNRVRAKRRGREENKKG